MTAIRDLMLDDLIIFHTLDKVVDRLYETIQNLSPHTVRSITARDWIVKCFI